jgi:hypothetical protein
MKMHKEQSCINNDAKGPMIPIGKIISIHIFTYVIFCMFVLKMIANDHEVQITELSIFLVKNKEVTIDLNSPKGICCIFFKNVASHRNYPGRFQLNLT